ncbi:MAG: hypothetical protein JWP45_2901 [Mucilaginibacter sp.]|nr:hypothetical protein [Mucilaginibacter sp.]
MIVSFSEAQFIEDEHGKKFLKLELIAHLPGMKIIIRNTFPATSNFDPIELAQSVTNTVALLTNPAQQNDADHSNQQKSPNK